ncbi:hypothetical protein A2U01_0057357, partial [Trifolium medium]|nr:hypothetical protein [Trifolium medium]
MNYYISSTTNEEEYRKCGVAGERDYEGGVAGRGGNRSGRLTGAYGLAYIGSDQ